MSSLRKYILERSMEAIDHFNNYDDYQDLIELFYELEYKYHRIPQRITNPIRAENMQQIIEEKGNIVCDKLAEGFQEIYEDWLGNHAITNPKQWAEARMKWGEEHGLIEELIEDEYNRYTGEKFWDYKTFRHIDIQKKIPTLYEWFELVADDYNSQKDAEEPDYSPESMEDIMFESTMQQYLEGVMRYNHNLYWKIIEEIYEHVLFPIWYAHWKDQGIDATRKRVEKSYEQLKKIKQQHITEKFVTINLAIQTGHQTGTMKDYLETLGIDFYHLDQMSKQSVTKWDKELK